LLHFLAYLRRRWVSALVLIFASTGLLDLYKSHFEVMQTNLNLPGAGGLCGALANRFFKYFGQFGATIIFAMLYLFSLYGLTDLRLGVWLREWWQSRRPGEPEGLAPEERALERRARELEKQALQLQGQLEKQREKP